jgi:hypothetical protein
MRQLTPVLFVIGFSLFATTGAHAGWSDTLKSVTDGAVPALSADGEGKSKGGIASGLSSAEMDGGLKDALAVGAERAIKGLGKSGGFLNDKAVRIPLPGPIRSLEGSLRMVGQGKLVDDFQKALNRAAEQAVPKAAPIVGDAIRGMSVSDARQILTGPDDAATRYFRDKTSGALAAAFLPSVKSVTDSTGVTKSFKKLTDEAGGLAGNDLDIDKYVTEKTLDGLFLKLADEEKSIRQNPAARSTDLLKKVFGSK